MKLTHLLGLMLVVAPLAAAGQSSVSSSSLGVVTVTQIGPGGKTTTLTIAMPIPCPVSMHANHLADGSMVKTGGAHPQRPGQWLHVTLTSPDKRVLAKATFNVHGWTAKGRMEQTEAGRKSAPTWRTIQTPLTAGSGKTASADIWAPGLSAVSSVELLSVAFADGSTWAPAAGKSCRVMPDLMMAIAR